MCSVLVLFFLTCPSKFQITSKLGNISKFEVGVGHAEGLPCEFEGILPSPVVDGYRNKCEFAIGLGPDGKQRVVGFQLGSFRSDLLYHLMLTNIYRVLNVSELV